MNSSDSHRVQEILFPGGTNIADPGRLTVLMAQYELFVDTSEKLVARRQSVNTFFLSVNTLSFSAIGLMVGLISNKVVEMEVAMTGVIAIAIAGILLCIAWRTLVRSYAQLNRGKFAVIHLIETQLPAALFTAEWEALGRGSDPEKYRPFTKTEDRVPIIFISLYGFSVFAGIVSFF